MNDTELAALAAAIDSTDIGTQCSVIPDDAPGRPQLIYAVRACRRLRESAADIISLAAEGRVSEALDETYQVQRHFEMMTKRLADARQAGAR